MKTTRQQQDATRRQIVASAVDLMTRQGFDGTTMKDIARAAGIGDATIYKYFPTKDRIVVGYLDDTVQQALADTLQTPGFDGYGLQEKLQRLTDAVLERLLADREFVAQVRGLARRSPLSMLAEPLAARQSLREAVASFLEAAEASGEIEPCDFKGMAGGLYTDYLAGVVTYWLADTSDEFADTTQLVDLSLGVLVQALRVGLVNRVVPPTEVNGYAQAQARKLAAKPLTSLIATKRLMKGGDQQAVLQKMDEEGQSFGRMLREPAAKEAFGAFMEKRKPDFSKL